MPDWAGTATKPPRAAPPAGCSRLRPPPRRQSQMSPCKGRDLLPWGKENKESQKISYRTENSVKRKQLPRLG
ncbi:rCG37106 [Rattus norvegicus]|uniref:RCG37106 n=1 Tax=Rattus norvegicus TaxID=10116 RepID=A6HUM8_RAT|nr:rCG37106 [Rattus norvegicus]